MPLPLTIRAGRHYSGLVYPTTDGIFAREDVLSQLTAAHALIAEHDPDRIVTLGGECSFSVAPFAHLAAKYGDDLAVVWVDVHTDTGMPESRYAGYHAMAFSHLLGHADTEVVATLPATVDASRNTLAGLHSWDDDQEPCTKAWARHTISPEVLNASSAALLDWLQSQGCSKVAIHIDLDSTDGTDIVFGLGVEPNDLTRAALVRALSDVARAVDVVGLTIAKYVPRQPIAMKCLLSELPVLRTYAPVHST